MDIGHELTSKQLLALQKRLAREYATAEREMRKKLKKHMDKFASELEDKQKLLDDGKIDEAKFLEWKQSRLMRSADMQTMIDDYVNERVKANQKAAAIINGSLPEAYAENYNYGTYQIEKSIKMDTAFTLHNKNAVKNLQARTTISVAKDRAWHNRKINSALTQGIMQGESIPKIQRRLLNIGIMDENAAMRNARTMMTSAQNEGRLDSYRRAADLGIKLKKTWIATMDDRVRDSHAEIDGETVPIDEPFSNGLMYPADPDGDPAEVYNCRCTMIVQIAGFERDITGSGLRPAKIGSYDEWKAAHIKTPPKKVIDMAKASAQYKYLRGQLDSASVEYRDVAVMSKPLPESDIIEKLGGGDKTSGSCASVGLAYCGNKCGLDVTDFRGGKSQQFFSSKYNLDRLAEIKELDAIVEKAKGTITAGNKLLKQAQEGKEYYFVAGKHAAIIRRKQGVLQYLELQSRHDNGWQDFNGNPRYTLSWRFGCQQSQGFEITAFMINVENFDKSDEFKDLLGFINTAQDKQMKGAGGHAK